MRWRGASQRLHSWRHPPSPPLLIPFRRRDSESKRARRRDLARAFVLMRGVRVRMHGVALKLDCGTQRRRGGFTSLTVG